MLMFTQQPTPFARMRANRIKQEEVARRRIEELERDLRERFSMDKVRRAVKDATRVDWKY